MATDTATPDAGAATSFGMAVVEVGLDLSALRRASRTTLRRAADEAGVGAGGTLGRAMGPAMERTAGAGVVGALRRIGARARPAAREEGRKVGEEVGAGVGEGAERTATRGPRSGDKVALRYTRMMERALEQEKGRIRAASAALLMTPAEAEEAGLAAARAYDKAILRGLNRLGTPGTRGRGRTAIGTDAYTRMAGTLILPEPNPARAQRSSDEVARRYISGLRQRLDADGARIKAELLAKLISPREAERRGTEAAERYQRALLRTMRRMQAEGRLSSGAAASFGSAMLDTQAFGASLREIAGAPGLLQRIGAAAKMWIAGAFVAALFGAATALRALIGTLQDAREALNASRRLEAAAKLFAVPLKDLKNLAAAAREEFELLPTQANQVATQVGKIAGRAEQAARAQELLNAAMDLGAANGMTLAEITEALDQTYRGLDDGLNRFGLSDPSQYFRAMAREIGTTEDKLTDAQKQMALMNAVINAGTKVQGAWGRQLQGDEGRLNRFQNRVQAARQEIGLHFIPVAADAADALEGPMSTAVRGITWLLDRMVPALDRVINKMREMGVEAARLRPLEVVQGIQRGQEEAQAQLGDIRSIAASLGIRQVNNRTIEAARRAAQAEVDRLEQLVTQASAQRPAPRAVTDPGTGATHYARDRSPREIAAGQLAAAQAQLLRVEQLSATYDAYGTTLERVQALEEELPTAREKAGLQQQLDVINRSITAYERYAREKAKAANVDGAAFARLNQQQRDAYLSAEQRQRLGQLREQASDLEVQINGPRPDAPPTPPQQPEKIKADVENARKALRELVGELGVLDQFRDAAGVPFRSLDEVPADLRTAIQSVLSLEDEIADIEERIRESGQAADPAIRRHLQGLRALSTERRAEAQRLRDDMAARGDLISEEAKKARDGLREAATGFQALQALGVGQDAPEALVNMVEEVTRLDEQLKEARANLDTLRRQNQAAPAGAVEWVAHLESQRAKTVQLLGTFQELRGIMDELPTLSADLFRDLDAAEVAAVRQQLGQLAEQSQRVREAEEALLLARQEHGEGSREAREAERGLTETRTEARRVLVAMIRAVQGSTMSLKEKRRVVALLRGELERLGGEVPQTAGKLRKIADAINLASDTVSSLARVGVELELINERQAEVIEGFAEMADNAAKFAVAAKTGNVPGMIQSGLGFVQGAVKFYQGLTGESEAQKAVRSAMLDLRDALQSLEETILNDRSTEDVSGDRASIARARESLAADRETHSSYGPTRRGALADLAVSMGLAKSSDSKNAQIEALRRWAAELDEKYGTNLAWFVENSRPEELLSALSQLESQLGRELSEMGTYGTDVAGVLARVNDELDILKENDAAERIARKTRALLASSNNLGEFVDELTELASLDLSTEAGRARRDAIIAEMMARGQATGVDFGAMTPEQFRELLREWAHAAPGEGGDVGADGSQRMNVSQTEAQGSAIMMQLGTQTYLQQQHLPRLSEIADRLASMSFAPVVQAAATMTAGPGGTTFNVTFEAGSIAPVLPAGTDSATARELGREHGRGLGDGMMDRVRARLAGAGATGPHRVNIKAGGLGS